MMFKVSSLLVDELRQNGKPTRAHPITHATIPNTTEANQTLKHLCGHREIEDLQNETRALLQEELFYRGILTPVHIDDEETYWKKKYPTEIKELTLFKSARTMPERVKTPWAVIGVPFDNGAAKPGCRYGPQLLRERSHGWCFKSHSGKPSLYNVSTRKTLAISEVISDLGDLRLRSDDSATTISKNLQQAIELLPYNTKLLTLGGDHSITSAPVLALNKKYPLGKDLCYVHIDQHTDLQTWGAWNNNALAIEELRHSNFVSHIKEQMPEININQIGIRRHQSLPDKNRDLWESLFENSVQNFIDDIEVAISDDASLLSRLPKGQNIYLSIDVDAITASQVKQTGYPSATGLEVRKLFLMLAYLCQKNHIVGADIMEFGKSSWPSEHQSESDLLLSLMLNILENAT
jgi:agmatinase